MKKICLYCGEEYFLFNRKNFCSTSCRSKMERRLPLNLPRDYKHFQHIVASAETCEEFAQLYEKYFWRDCREGIQIDGHSAT